jgi:molybdate transport system substrate-binding protein
MANQTPQPGSLTAPHRTRHRAALVLVALLATLGLFAGCGSDSTSGSTPATTESTPTVTGTVTVFAAASLKDAFAEAAVAFEKANPGAKVTLNFGSSSALAQQIAEKAPADVFASADQANMQKVVDGGGISGSPRVFATNSLEIIVASGNPKGITGLADLSTSGLIYVTAAPEVPIGKYAAQALQTAGVTVSPSSLEADVKAVVTKVTSGEADAAIVYATDVKAASAKAEGVTIPAEFNVVATYPLGVTTEAADPNAAAAWVAFITGGEGQAILASYGFGAP